MFFLYDGNRESVVFIGAHKLERVWEDVFFKIIVVFVFIVARVECESSSSEQTHHRLKKTTKRSTTKTTKIRAVMTPPEQQRVFTRDLKRPDENGRYGGVYGGKYVPETLVPALLDLEQEYEKLKTDPAFIEEFDQVLKDYVGRANPLYFAERLSERYKKPDGSMPHIYFKREDLNHTDAHKINNAIGPSDIGEEDGEEAHHRGDGRWAARSGDGDGVREVRVGVHHLYGRGGYGETEVERVSHAIVEARR